MTRLKLPISSTPRFEIWLLECVGVGLEVEGGPIRAWLMREVATLMIKQVSYLVNCLLFSYAEVAKLKCLKFYASRGAVKMTCCDVDN